MTCRLSITELAARLDEGRITRAEASDTIAHILAELGLTVLEQEVPLADHTLRLDKSVD